MDTNRIIGITLLVAGISDVAVAYLLLAPRLKDENTRGIVVTAVAGTGAAMAAAGIALIAGWFSVL